MVVGGGAAQYVFFVVVIIGGWNGGVFCGEGTALGFMVRLLGEGRMIFGVRGEAPAKFLKGVFRPFPGVASRRDPRKWTQHTEIFLWVKFGGIS